jgi:hypothetical protein
MLYVTSDRKQRVCEGIKSVSYAAIAIILLIGTIVFLIWYKDWGTEVTPDDTALTKTYDIAFQLDPTWGTCPQQPNECFLESNIQTLTGPIKLASNTNTTIGDLDGICVSIDYNATIYSAYVKCSFTLTFNGNGSIPNGTAVVSGVMHINYEGDLYDDFRLSFIGGTGAYSNPGGGYLFSTMDPDTTFNEPLNMSFTSTHVV